MKKMFGYLLLGLAALIEACLILVLARKGLAAAGLIDKRGGPTFLALLMVWIILQPLLMALAKAGLAISETRGRIGVSPSAQINLLFVALVISVVAFGKTLIPYLQHKAPAYGIAALVSAVAFGIFCVLVFRVWNKAFKL
jgi:hypothetical protein